MVTLMDTLTTQVATYTGDSQLAWREEETSQLPLPARYGLRAAVVDNHIYITGGISWYNNGTTTILRWDPSTESWQYAGDLAVARSIHAAVAVPSSLFESECSALILK